MKTILIFTVSIAIVGVLTASGCGRNVPPAVKPADQHAEHSEHAHSTTPSASAPATLHLKADLGQPTAQQVTKLDLMIHGADEKVVKDFEPTHEKLAHLIIVRQELDEFAHLHPHVDEDGNLSIEHTFPVGGTYHLFVDYKQAGKSPATVRATLKVDGNAPPGSELTPNAPGTLGFDDISAVVAFNPQSEPTRVLTFKIQDLSGKEVNDLEPYLGAMGHLVVLSSDAKQYVHAHPLTAKPNGGIVAFEVHFPGPGIYKVWGQFQRSGRVLTVPAVVQIKSLGQGAH